MKVNTLNTEVAGVAEERTEGRATHGFVRRTHNK